MCYYTSPWLPLCQFPLHEAVQTSSSLGLFFFVVFFFKASALVYTPVRLGAQMLTPHYPRRATDEAAKRLPGSFSFVFNRPTAVAAVLVAVEFS